jgi:hypothetical protein
VVERKGGWIYYGERKWQGVENFANSLREEVDLFEELRKEILSARILFSEEEEASE